MGSGCFGETSQTDVSTDSNRDETKFTYPDVGPLPPPGFVDYFLRWDLSHLGRQSGSWTTESNLGYAVTIESGWLSNYRVTLAACSTTGFLDFINGIIPYAHANDGGFIDESQSTSGVAENLMVFANQQWIRRPLQNHEYCKLHHLIARADETVLMRPTAVDLNRTTLMIKGIAVKADVATPFEISSAFAHGNLHALNELLTMHQSKVDVSGRERIQVVIERRPAQWFDDIDFETVQERQLAHLIGSQIMSTTVYHVKAQD